MRKNNTERTQFNIMTHQLHSPHLPLATYVNSSPSTQQQSCEPDESISRPPGSSVDMQFIIYSEADFRSALSIGSDDDSMSSCSQSGRSEWSGPSGSNNQPIIRGNDSTYYTSGADDHQSHRNATITSHEMVGS
jgi:hypothetical protein